MAQVIAYFTGFETGDASELVSLGTNASVQTTTVRTGAYSLKAAANNSVLKNALGSTQTVVRFYVNPTGTGTLASMMRENTTVRLQVRRNADDTVNVSDNGVTLGLTSTNGTAKLLAGNWACVVVAWDLAAGGVVKVWVNGVLDIDTTHTSDVSGTTTNNIQLIARANPNEYFYDDCRIDTGGVAQIGHGQTIVRQGLAGTPTYDAWTKYGGATADACWSDTPFDTTNYCDDTGLNAFQTMFTASFATPQTGHGTQVIEAADTINACKVAIIGKSSVTAGGAGAASIRRRVGGADTDTAITFTTSDKYFDTGIFTDTLTNLNTYEIGGGHGGVAATHTIRDAWLMVDYTLGGGPVPVVWHGTFTGIFTGSLNGTFTFA